MVFRGSVLAVCFATASAHAFMTVPASRNLNQCLTIGHDGLPILKFINGCLITQDRIGFIPGIEGGCGGLPCVGTGCVIKFYPGSLIPSGGHETCSPGNYPGVVPIKNVCGDPTNDLFILPGLGAHFKKDKPQAVWQAGTVVDVQVNYFLNHAGNYQFRLCLDGADNWDNDDCFKELPLLFEDGSDWKWLDSNFMPLGIKLDTFVDGYPRKDRVVIPDWVECEVCTLNYRWDAALEAAVFSNCAEVTIERPGGANLVTSSGLCLDTPGSNYENGQPLWIWECTGTVNQQFVFAEGTWQIVPAMASNLCVDAGDMNVGNQLMLWECNGAEQQSFGYDDSAGTIYLNLEDSEETYAGLCLMVEGDWNSAKVLLAECDSAEKWGFSSFSSRLQNAKKNPTNSTPLVYSPLV